MDEVFARTFVNQWMMCAACKRVLERKTLMGTVSWQHPTDMLRTEDHPAIPVPLDEETVEEKCDVCFTDHPQWVLPARDFQAHPALPISTSNWALCDVCAALVKGDRWEALYERAVENYEARHGAMLPEGHAIIRTMYAMLRENVTGEIHRRSNR